MRPEMIRKILPQREPMLMVDDILEVRYKESVLGYKKIRASEGWAKGHFPDMPVFPGVLLIEHMAQTALFLWVKGEESETEGSKQKPYLAKVEQVKFLKPVLPGMELYTYVKEITESLGFVKVRAEVFADREQTEKIAAGRIVCYLGEE